VHAAPLNHVGLRADDLPAAVAWMTAQGARFAPGGIRKGAAGHDICFIHPRGSDEFLRGGDPPHFVQAGAGAVGEWFGSGGGQQSADAVENLADIAFGDLVRGPWAIARGAIVDPFPFREAELVQRSLFQWPSRVFQRNRPGR